MIAGLFFISFISSTILTYIDSTCPLSKLNNQEWVYECDGNCYTNYLEVLSVCMSKHSKITIYMIRRTFISSGNNILPNPTITITTTRTPITKNPTTISLNRVTSTTRRTIASTTARINKISTNKPSSEIDIESLRKKYLDETNKYRQLHGVQNLTENREIDNLAQKYAEKLANKFNGMLEHDSDRTYGENLAFVPLSRINEPVKLWYDEIKDYNFNNPGFGMKTGHFTQVVWNNTKEMGCGIANLSGKYKEYCIVSCKYNPPGNYMNQFEQNVLPIKN